MLDPVIRKLIDATENKLYVLCAHKLGFIPDIIRIRMNDQTAYGVRVRAYAIDDAKFLGLYDDAVSQIEEHRRNNPSDTYGVRTEPGSKRTP